jgi:uncharacterized integral membrane protein
MVEGGLGGSKDVGWRPSGRQIGMAVVIGIVVLFAVFNLEEASIDFLVTSVSIPLVFVIAACAILGFTAGYLFAKHLDKRD